MKGHFVTMVSVWCGLCEIWMDLDETKKRKCATDAKSAGWRLTRKHGWLCPECAGPKPNSREGKERKPMPDSSWTPYTASRPNPGTKVEWITPGGAQVRGTFCGGVVWIPEGSNAYVYYTPAFWRYIHA